MINIKKVETKKDWEEFIDLPFRLYEDNPYWVPPLRLQVKELLDVNKNPFFRHAYMHPILAYRGDELVGRLVGVIDDHHNRIHKEMTAFFGFLECHDDSEVVTRMMEEVRRWAKGWGMNTLRGPMSPSTNHECGLLVDGFEDTNTVMMPYNHAYYERLVEKAGFHKAKDLYAYYIHASSKFSQKLLGHAERLRSNHSIKFRTINLKRYEEEIEMLLELYNDAWEDNWGFVPMTEDEFRHMAKEMKPILDPELVLVAEVHGKPAGFALTVPDVNQAMIHVKNGRLFPFGWAKLLWYLKGPGRHKALDRCRIITLGIMKKYRRFGIGPLLYAEYLKRGPGQGYPTGEASWILEDNVQMNKALKRMDAKRVKTYRVYDSPLN